MRNIDFQNSEYYHIFNRGVDKRDIFCDDKDFVRFIIGMRELNQNKTIESLYRLNEIRKKERLVQKEAELPIGSSASQIPLVEFISYALLNNHFHFILKQKMENGIIKFMHKLGTSYTKYFNFKYERSGSLFQGTYKAIHIKSDSQLLRLSSYINGNSEVHKIYNAENYPWSSYQDYLGKRNGTLCNKETILNEFENINEYKEFTNYVILESQEIKNELNYLE